MTSGGDTGIDRVVAILYAKKDADVPIVYSNEHAKAKQTKREMERYGRKNVLIPGRATPSTASSNVPWEQNLPTRTSFLREYEEDTPFFPSEYARRPPEKD